MDYNGFMACLFFFFYKWESRLSGDNRDLIVPAAGVWDTL